MNRKPATMALLLGAGLLMVSACESRVYVIADRDPVVTYYTASGLHQIGPGQLPGSQSELLQTGRATCASLGLDPRPATCTTAAVLTASATQTDPTLWYATLSATKGEPLIRCPAAVAFDRWRTRDGETGTTWLCRATEEDDRITPDERAEFRAYVAKLDRAQPPTLADYLALQSAKSMIDTYTRPMTGTQPLTGGRP